MSDSGDRQFPRRRYKQGKKKYEFFQLSSVLPRLRRSIGLGKKKRARSVESSDPNRVFFELLEPRYLLPADISPLVIAMADAGHDLTLKLDASDMLQVINDQSDAFVGQQQASRPSQIQIVGASDNDRLTVAAAVAAGLAAVFAIAERLLPGTQRIISCKTGDSRCASTPVDERRPRHTFVAIVKLGWLRFEACSQLVVS